VARKSTVESPVRLTALTETKNAWIQDMPPWVEAGSLSRSVPSAITAAKPPSRQLHKIIGHSPVSRQRPFQPLVIFS
jgi:hypothetical protein